MGLAAYLLSALLGFLGLVFLLGAQGQAMRAVVGIVLFAAAGSLIYLTRARPKTVTVQQQVELSGDVAVQELHCKACGGTLSAKSVSVRAGAVFVRCEYCQATYQLEEAPKW